VPLNSNRRRMTALLWILVLAGGGVSALAESSDPTARDVEIMGILDRYMDGLNDLDMEGHVATYHFPHYRHASGEIVIWQTPSEAMPILELPMEERKAAVRKLLAKDWDRSVWTKREIVQGDDQKVHVATQFVRLRKDGSVIATYDSLYVMTRQDGRWGIKGRSSFAP
jgi:hypothetical protein